MTPAPSPDSYSQAPLDEQGNPMIRVGCPNCGKGEGWENVITYVGHRNSGRDLAGPCSTRCRLQLEHAEHLAEAK